MLVLNPIWKEYGVPERIYAHCVRTRGDKFARAFCIAWRRKMLAEEAEATREEEALAEQAWKRGPQVTPDNGLGAVVQFEMSPWRYAVLHNNSVALEPGCTGGEFLRDRAWMKRWLDQNERCKRATAPHANRVGYTARLEAARQAGEEDRARTQALVAGLLEDAALEGRRRIVA